MLGVLVEHPYLVPSILMVLTGAHNHPQLQLQAVGSQRYARLSQWPWWKDKGDVSSVSLSRSRLDKVQSGSGAWTLKDLRFLFLGSQLSPWKGCGLKGSSAWGTQSILVPDLSLCWPWPLLLQTIYRALFLTRLLGINQQLVQDLQAPVIAFVFLIPNPPSWHLASGPCSTVFSVCLKGRLISLCGTRCPVLVVGAACCWLLAAQLLVGYACCPSSAPLTVSEMGSQRPKLGCIYWDVGNIGGPILL